MCRFPKDTTHERVKRYAKVRSRRWHPEATMISDKTGVTEYLVRQKGFPPAEDTESEEEVQDQEALDTFEGKCKSCM